MIEQPQPMSPANIAVIPKLRAGRALNICAFVVISMVATVPQMSLADATTAIEFSQGFLTPEEFAAIESELPQDPDPDANHVNPPDEIVYQETRAVLHSARGIEAAQDDIYAVDEFVPTFSASFGARLSRQQQPVLFALLDNLLDSKTSAYQIISYLKHRKQRRRPILVHSNTPDNCVEPEDIAGYHDNDLKDYPFGQDSFPSGHSFRGMLTALVLMEVHPEHAAALYDRGFAFGESRVICGFHWESDVAASRLAALIVMEKLRTKAEFRAALDKVRAERPQEYHDTEHTPKTQ